MSRNLCFFLLFNTVSLYSQEAYRVLLQPLDFQEGREEFYLSGIDQIESDGAHLYLRSLRETEIIVITPEGHLVNKFGGKGGHPSEFGDFGVLAMALRDNQLWAIDSERERVRRFVDGIYEHSFRLTSYNVFFANATANVFAFSEDLVVVPADPNTKHLAAVHRFDGTLVKHVGDHLPFTEDLARRVPGIHDTFWLYQNGSWFSIHKFLAVVTRYDADFKRVNQFQVESVSIRERLNHIQDFTSNDKFNVPGALITDVKIHHGDLYLMSGGYLHRVDLQDGTVKSITAFYGTGTEFEEVGPSNVTLFFFAFLDSDKLVLAHPAMLWDHDLWTVNLPFPTQSRN